MTQEIFQVDAFSDKPFGGNPAAVCILSEDRGDQWMQLVANEMNLSETAFLRKRADGGYDLRWFTPQIEVDLCGHATLASAHVLWQEKLLALDETARFYTRSGLLTAQHQQDLIELNFPVKPETRVDDESLVRALVDALRAAGQVNYVGRNSFDFLVELSSEREVRALEPDFGRLKRLDVRGVIVTARADASSDYDFVSRFFAPGSGIDEDPVTGSAHCCLAKFWSERLGKNEFRAIQVSKRGGQLFVRLEGNRVRLGGRAVTTLRGRLFC
jgi:PhzF family phenazine biosynthesis protein